MSEKPYLVIIGETHIAAIERALISRRQLMIKQKTRKSGERRLIFDASSGRTRENVKKINQLIKKEVEILRKEKITTLFLERGVTQERKEIYARYKKDHNVKQTKESMRRERKERMNTTDYKMLKRMLSDLAMSDSLRKAVLSYYKSKKAEPNYIPFIFADIHLNVAHKAGIYNLMDTEDNRLHVQAVVCDFLYDTFCHNLKDLKAHIKSSIELPYIEKSMLMLEIERLIETIPRALDTIWTDLHEPRDISICKAILKNHTPRSALICGSAHLESIKKLLSKKFELKTYNVEGLL